MTLGTVECPYPVTKTHTYPEQEVQKLLDEVDEIKHLLFCRLLLGHAALLPAALRANSVEQFLADEEVTATSLRDLCLKMEQPDLQQIRDACADLFRSGDEQDEDSMQAKDVQLKVSEGKKSRDTLWKPKSSKKELPDKWKSKREKA